MLQQSTSNQLSSTLSPSLSLDIDECAEGKHYCRENTMCVNTPGSFMCICHTGYIRIDDYSCTGEFLHWPFFDRLESSGNGIDFYCGYVGASLISSIHFVWRLLAGLRWL